MRIKTSFHFLVVFFAFVNIHFAQQKVGINETNPKVSLDVAGRIQISEETATPLPGQIRWNSTTGDFEGYDGSKWVSFTAVSIIQGSVSTSLIQDIDGNAYPTVMIGAQEWMAENLRTTRYNDGSLIPYVPKKVVWRQLDNLGQDAYTWPDYDLQNKYPYGALYNGFSIATDKLCPTGWTVPAESDWIQLSAFLASDQGGKLKQTGNLATEDGLFNSPNVGATNSTGFSGIPAGYISATGDAVPTGTIAFFATKTFNSGNLVAYWLSNSSSGLSTGDIGEEIGYSIRCIKE